MFSTFMSLCVAVLAWEYTAHLSAMFHKTHVAFLIWWVENSEHFNKVFATKNCHFETATESVKHLFEPQRWMVFTMFAPEIQPKHLCIACILNASFNQKKIKTQTDVPNLMNNNEFIQPLLPFQPTSSPSLPITIVILILHLSLKVKMLREKRRLIHRCGFKI